MTPQEESYRIIPLTRERVAIVDASNYAWLNQWKWHAHWDNNSQSFYAVRRTTEEGKRGRVFMHRAVLGLSPSDPRKGDHKYRNTLDNRRANLRIATSAQNTQNSKVRCDSLSGYKGVSFNHGKWRATIGSKAVRRYLGTFPTKEDAAIAYNEAAKKLYGEFACLNVIGINP